MVHQRAPRRLPVLGPSSKRSSIKEHRIVGRLGDPTHLGPLAADHGLAVSPDGRPGVRSRGVDSHLGLGHVGPQTRISVGLQPRPGTHGRGSSRVRVDLEQADLPAVIRMRCSAPTSHAASMHPSSRVALTETSTRLDQVDVQSRRAAAGADGERLDVGMVLLPIIYVLSMIWAWIRRARLRAKLKSGTFGLSSL